MIAQTTFDLAASLNPAIRDFINTDDDTLLQIHEGLTVAMQAAVSQRDRLVVAVKQSRGSRREIMSKRLEETRKAIVDIENRSNAAACVLQHRGHAF